jgi:deoxyribodipyrimidine photo-lyase
VSPGTLAGGEPAAGKQLTAWLRSGIAAYEDRHEDPAGDATSRRSPRLHCGTLSPVELAHRARKAGGSGEEAFVRQLAWRDSHRQVPAARPVTADIEAWREGRAGDPVIDAAMRQLRHDGWTHHRGRADCGFLTKTPYGDRRVGARHFLGLPADGDLANDRPNRQWVAGTGTRPRLGGYPDPIADLADGPARFRWAPAPPGTEPDRRALHIKPK